MSTPLPSWRDTATRAAIIDFVTAVTNEAGTEYVSPEARVAVFDNDGTLWCEKPMPVQLHYLLQVWKAAVAQDPSLAERQPYHAAATGDLVWLGAAIDKHYAGDDSDLKLLIGAVSGATADFTVEEYAAEISDFFRDARHLTLGTPYALTIYQPMVELLGYLAASGFSTYIVSGGDRDFMRPMSEGNYQIPPERVVGTGIRVSYDADANTVRYGPSLEYFNDGAEKPPRIWMRIGRRPILAGGNSNGDVPMLRFVQGHPRSLSLLVNHDDDTGRGDAPYTKGAEQAIEAAGEHGFVVVSVRDDWSQVFPDDAAAAPAGDSER